MLVCLASYLPSYQVRCLVDVPGEKLPADLPAYLRATVAHQLPDELRPAFLTALEAEPIRSMQNKQLTSQPLHQPGTCMTSRRSDTSSDVYVGWQLVFCKTSLQLQAVASAHLHCC